MTVHAAVLYYRILYYVFHNEPCDIRDPIRLHERIRTLATELMLLFDDTRTAGNATPAALKTFARQALGERNLAIRYTDLKIHMDRVARLGQIVAAACRKRIELYKALSLQ